MIFRILLVCLMIGNSAIADRIAILSYGSLVNRPKHSVTGACICASKFRPTNILFPVSIVPLANTNRITAVIDARNGKFKRVWAALSDFDMLNNAIQNLAAREGAVFLKNKNQYDTHYIVYIRKLKPDQEMQNDEVYIHNAQKWVMHDNSIAEQKLDDTIVHEIIQFAQDKNYDAVVWVSCPIKHISCSDFIHLLISDPVMLKNAQNYIKTLPDGAETPFEHAIIEGKQSLMKLMRSKK